MTPTAVDLRPLFPPVFDQGASPADISGALVSAFQFRDPDKFTGSRMFLEYNTQYLMERYQTESQKQNPTDSQLHFSVVALLTYGLPLETDWPYNASSATSRPPDSLYASASKHKLLSVMNPGQVDPDTELKNSLVGDFPWIVALKVDSSWYYDPVISGTTSPDGTLITKGTGVISQQWQKSAFIPDMGHITVLVVGFDDSHQHWIARTSLGASMGDGGYYYFPYTFVTLENMVSLIWCIRTVSTKDTPVDCVMNPGWSQGVCNPPVGVAPQSCGWAGTRTDTRTVQIPAYNGGSKCPVLSQVESCLGPVCPVPCEVSAWSYGICEPGTPAPTVACGWNGTKIGTRTVTTPASDGGAACPALTRTIVCSAPACPQDCLVGDWSEYSACDATVCGTTGNQTSVRLIDRQAKSGGTACPTLTQRNSCNAPACATDCHVGEWSDWSQCSSTLCGTLGSKTTTRSVLQTASNGGQQCPALSSTVSCDPPCEVEQRFRIVFMSAALVLILAISGAVALL